MSIDPRIQTLFAQAEQVLLPQYASTGMAVWKDRQGKIGRL